MAHIDLPTTSPGIRGLFEFRPETAAPRGQLAEVLLRGDNTLERGERELIAAYVSSLNDCHFCMSSHAAFAALQLPDGWKVVDGVLIAAAFCMFNRYVDGLGTFAPPDRADYVPMAEQVVTNGYVGPR